jgi:hypothetical protein
MSLVPLLSAEIGVSEVEVGTWDLPGYLAVPEQASDLSYSPMAAVLAV